MAEHLSVEQDVAGSTPVSHPRKLKLPHEREFLVSEHMQELER
jgi:hypothetical protein